MDAETLDLEDGEVVDDESDAFGTYKILQRPHTVTNPQKITSYSDDTEESSESASDSDSQSDVKKIKRPKLKARRRKIESNSSTLDKYKIWNTQVQEEALTADLISCGVTRKLYQGRNVENYDLPSNYNLNGYKNLNNASSDEEKDQAKYTNFRTSNKRTHADRSNVKLRLGKRANSMDVDAQKGCGRTISELSITIESSESDVACDIADKLREKKDSLIKRVVDMVGKEKAIEFYEKTKEIEENGGMLIMNGSRRRTPGGVYLYLVKNDEHIPQEKIREIFAVDKKEVAEQRKKADVEKLREKANQLMKNLENGSEKDLPALLTRAELSTRQIAEEARLRRGEGMNRAPHDTDRTVSNPPPSPATDDPDHSEHVAVQRQVQDYSDDFLDIGVDIDSMETF